MAAILGTVGVPASYGGFETLAENLVVYNQQCAQPRDLAVYCSSKSFPGKPESYRGAVLRYVNLDANGVQSIPYDIAGLFDAVQKGERTILLLGVSGAIALPALRLFSRARLITNVDGIEWKREKWRGIAKFYLRMAEWIAVKSSHEVIADNQAIADYLYESYGASSHVIPYGGDHALDAEPDLSALKGLPDRYALGLCRVEPENNVDMILTAFAQTGDPLVFVGNWDRSEYGRTLKREFGGAANIHIHDPVYDPGKLRAIRGKASLYLHGHSAGGTNPALVEMMHFGIPIIAHGCTFNRHTTEDQALYFEHAAELEQVVTKLSDDIASQMGAAMKAISQRRYCWSTIGRAYFDLLDKNDL